MKVFFIYILVFLFQLKKNNRGKKGKETPIRNFHQSVLKLSRRKTSYLSILFWKNKAQKSNSKWSSVAVTGQYYVSSWDFFFLVRGRVFFHK